MRLWSLHPSYLDAKGLFALWREGLLALHVLKGQTRGYRHHPQLERFKAQANPVTALEGYLWNVYDQATRRGYHFDAHKLSPRAPAPKIRVTIKQLAYEFQHLKRKLKQRDPARYRLLRAIKKPRAHPRLRIVPGAIEAWERIET